MSSKTHHPTRNPSSPRTPSSQRPKLMRASTTAPSIATSHASRKDYSNYQTSSSSSSRATTLLTLVASYSSSATNQDGNAVRGHGGASSPEGSESSLGSPEQSSPESAGGYGMRMGGVNGEMYQTGAYVSFPSFEDFPDYPNQQERSGNGT